MRSVTNLMNQPVQQPVQHPVVVQSVPSNIRQINFKAGEVDQFLRSQSGDNKGRPSAVPRRMSQQDMMAQMMMERQKEQKKAKRKQNWMSALQVAGILSTIAFVGFMIGHFTRGIYTTGLVQTFYLELVLANLGFMVFNLLPIPPLDGSRVLYAIAPDGIREVMERMEQTIGIILVLILVVFFGTYLSQFTSNIVMNILYFFISLVS